ncbi:hypothetical protein T11_10155 [Trichinella zimbabwensis]|uniref:Uncharacterized protein n=1 Tax=Trichinella zimbabwensis TaxID=268475 RepID=A0A0V1H4L8_9BILA|nr:hypothetical protein T11_10155 [Trichinella zimbabwensis]
MDGSEYSESKIEELRQFCQKLRERHFFFRYVKVEDPQATHVENERTSVAAEEPRKENSSLLDTNAQYRENLQKIEAKFQQTAEKVDYLRKMYLMANGNHRKLCKTTSKDLQECQNLNNLCNMLFLQDAHILNALSKIKDIFADILFVEKQLKLKSKKKEAINTELQRNSESWVRKCNYLGKGTEIGIADILQLITVVVITIFNVLFYRTLLFSGAIYPIQQASLESAAVALENSTLSELLLETHRKLHAIIDEKNRQLKALKLLNCEFHNDLMLADYLTGMLSQVEAEVVERERSVADLNTIYNKQIKDPDIEKLQSLLEFRIQLASEGISETTELLKTLCNDLDKSGLYFEKEAIKERIAKVELKKCRLENEQSLASLTELESVISDTREQFEEDAVILDALYKKIRNLEDSKSTNRSYMFILSFVMPTNEREKKLKEDQMRSLNMNYAKLAETVICQSQVEKECLLDHRLPLRNCFELPLTVRDLPLDDADCDAIRQLSNERENEMQALEEFRANINEENSIEQFWRTACDKIDQLERAILLACNNGQCHFGDTIVQKNYIENEIKVLSDKHAKLTEQYENFQEEKGRLVEMRRICDTLNENLLSLHQSVKETCKHNLKLDVHTLVNKEPQVVHGFSIPQMSPIEKVQTYLTDPKNKNAIEAMRKRQRYNDRNNRRRRRNVANSNVQARGEMDELSSVVGTSSAGQNNESTVCNCGRAECGVCNPPAENAQ